MFLLAKRWRKEEECSSFAQCPHMFFVSPAANSTGTASVRSKASPSRVCQVWRCSNSKGTASANLRTEPFGTSQRWKSCKCWRMKPYGIYNTDIFSCIYFLFSLQCGLLNSIGITKSSGNRQDFFLNCYWNIQVILEIILNQNDLNCKQNNSVMITNCYNFLGDTTIQLTCKCLRTKFSFRSIF